MKIYSIWRKEMKQILFYVSEVAHFWDGMKPLFDMYMEQGEQCTVIFPAIEYIKKVGRGLRNADRINQIMDKIKGMGAETYYKNEWNSSGTDFDICFTYSDYIKVNADVRRHCRYVVAVQITAIYTHVYVGVSGVEQLFGTQGSKNIDYFVVSDFAADWISQKIDWIQTKLLRFGYPRLDNLFKETHNTGGGDSGKAN